MSSEFWRNLSSEFQATREDYHNLNAVWDCIWNKAIANWKLVETSAGAGKEFEALARRAGAELPNPESPDLMISWLEALRDYRRDPWQSYTVVQIVNGKQEEVFHRDGVIRQVFQVSSELCKALECEALQAEYEERQRNALKCRLRANNEIDNFDAKQIPLEPTGQAGTKAGRDAGGWIVRAG